MNRHRAQLAASASSAGFVIAAAVVGTANVLAPFERGWWLTAYLFLVGGLAQLLLIRGQDALTAGRREPPASLVWMQWGLWNAGTAIVAVADMAHTSMSVVYAGSMPRIFRLAIDEETLTTSCSRLYAIRARRAISDGSSGSCVRWRRG